MFSEAGVDHYLPLLPYLLFRAITALSGFGETALKRNFISNSFFCTGMARKYANRVWLSKGKWIALPGNLFFIIYFNLPNHSTKSVLRDLDHPNPLVFQGLRLPSPVPQPCNAQRAVWMCGGDVLRWEHMFGGGLSCFQFSLQDLWSSDYQNLCFHVGVPLLQTSTSSMRRTTCNPGQRGV